MRRVAMLLVVLLTITATATTATATPFHAAPKWWTATVNGPDAINEHYGLYRSREAAEKFCRRIPSPRYTCKAEALIPEEEWLRKGAR